MVKWCGPKPLVTGARPFRARLGAFASACLLLYLPAKSPLAGRDGERWPEITEAERNLTRLETAPGSDAVILNKERNGRILRPSDEWVNILEYHWRLKVLTEAGKRFAKVRLPAWKRSRVSNIRARTVKPDGTVFPVEPDRILRRATAPGGSRESKEWVFEFPAVEPGDILEYRYDRYDDALVYIKPFYFDGPVHTLRAKVTQAIPKGSSYSFLCENCPAGVRPTVSKWREGKIQGEVYGMELGNLPGYREEIFMPPRGEVSPRLEILLHTWKDHVLPALGRQDRFFVDWNSVARFANFYYRWVIEEGLSEIRSHAANWTGGAEDREEKIRRILFHVQNDFRYLPFQRVIGATRPLEAILRRGNADNEEKAVLLMAALEAEGIESKPVLVAGRDFGPVNPNFFSLSQFTHAMVAVEKPGGGYEWLDPTVSFVPFGFLPWRDSGASAFLIEGNEGKLVTLPVRNQLNITRCRVQVTPRAEGLAGLKIEAEFGGEEAAGMRAKLIPPSEASRAERLAEWLRDRRPGAELRSHSVENLETFEEPLRIRMEAEAAGIVTLDEEMLFVRGCILSGYESNPVSRPDRVHPVYIDRGWTIQEIVEIAPPEGMEAVEMPVPEAARSAGMKMTFRCSKESGGGARCSRRFTARPGRWPPSEIESIRKMFDGIVEADRSVIVFRRAVASGGS